MGPEPVFEGGVKETVAEATPAAADTPVGAPGAVPADPTLSTRLNFGALTFLVPTTERLNL
jgi:hypothetical protein